MDDDIKLDNIVKTFQNIINNPISKGLLNKSLEYCPNCKEIRLKSSLDYYLGKKNHICFKCKATYKFIKVIINKALKSFNTSEKSFKRVMMNEYWEIGLISTFKGLAKFGANKPFTPGSPYQIVWNITKACNFNCLHCYENAGKKEDDELSIDEILNGIDKLSSFGVASLAFSGGEPSIHPHIKEILEYSSKKGFYTSMATNGYIFDNNKKVKDFADTGLEFVQISLDGLNPKTHDKFRQVKGSWEKAVKAIENFKKTDVFVEVSTTVTKNNINEISELITFLRRLNVDWLIFYNFIPTGNGHDITNIDITPEERSKLLKLVYDENKKGKMQILSTAPQFADVVTHTHDNSHMIPTHFFNAEYQNPGMMKLAEFVGGCGAGRFYMSIEPNGDIYPCVFFPHNKEVCIGNINNDLEDIWINNKLLNNLRNKDILKGHCGKCESKYICGGCRARAYTYFKDINCSDPGCEKNNEEWSKILSEI